MESQKDAARLIDEQNRISRIRELNDLLRKGRTLGRLVLTRGIIALNGPTRERILLKINMFDEFGPDNDPYGEHDFGLVVVGTVRVFWKIDYYDLNMQYAADDPSDAQRTIRVLTVMLASEY